MVAHELKDFNQKFHLQEVPPPPQCRSRQHLGKLALPPWPVQEHLLAATCLLARSSKLLPLHLALAPCRLTDPYLLKSRNPA